MEFKATFLSSLDGVQIGGSWEVYGGAGVFLGEGVEYNVAEREAEEDVGLAYADGEVEANREGEAGDVEHDGEDCRGGGVQYSDELVKAVVPHSQDVAPGIRLAAERQGGGVAG